MLITHICAMIQCGLTHFSQGAPGRKLTEGKPDCVTTVSFVLNPDFTQRVSSCETTFADRHDVGRTCANRLRRNTQSVDYCSYARRGRQAIHQ